ncbi:unnamed protein product (macronuclear) [Paramecium tetraurelia]|uniref:P-type domain-containing protein n=1 Tax=Paramecium tetraurelia TaxID=5888 RepID=A0DH64_PARTE|nr:uncharacterized protein GSPATT00016767001 [Paramecium tetraurelia]CAK82381.1 unnamed protein product [Paramecium tetraurelia]|eukprot:XP_001449778.1 hypothetical protein (macronuclear) [Paramecium tetraurelia strain d4-2]
MIFAILLIVNQITSSVAYTYIGETPCSGLAIGSCTSSGISGIGYCYWESSCQTLPCYMIDEVAACRTGSGLATGGASTLCDSLETFSLQYDNVCCDKSEGKLNYAFVRYTKTSDGYYDKASDGTTTLTSLTTQNSATIFQLYTVNPWLIMPSLTSLPTAANFESQLGAILTQYKTLATALQTMPDSHPFYLERTVYQSLQMLRDFVVLQTTSQNTMRDNLVQKIWSVALIALFRMVNFQPNYYQTNYYFINFAIIPYSRNSITINGQQHTTKIDWSGYLYTSNGYLMVYSFPPEIFGIRNAYSDVVCLRPMIGNPPVYAAAQNTFDTGFKPLTITWSWTDTSMSVVAANLKLYKFPVNTALETDILQEAGVTFTCNLGAKYCVSSSITSTPANTGVNYFVSPGLGVVGDKNKVQCRLQGKTWSGTCA